MTRASALILLVVSSENMCCGISIELWRMQAAGVVFLVLHALAERRKSLAGPASKCGGELMMVER